MNKTPDLCIWSNKAITDIGKPLWNDSDRLVERKVYSISDPVDVNGEILSYQNFRIKHIIRKEDQPMSEYGV
jgi:hypothetical protein